MIIQIEKYDFDISDRYGYISIDNRETGEGQMLDNDTSEAVKLLLAKAGYEIKGTLKNENTSNK